MQKLRIFDENVNEEFTSNDNSTIKDKLKELGIRFEQWSADFEVKAEHSNEEILKAYNTEIQKLVKEHGYSTFDVISLNSSHPDKDGLRAKFLSEHTHSEDEVRFFVKGQGLFVMHIDKNVISILCEKNDLISVPANIPHWFDMGSSPDFTAIRLFNNPEGWVANYTGDDIAQRFPKLP